jgi:hypothetical protein
MSRYQDWSPEQNETLRTLYLQGLSFSEIGRAMGRTKNSCKGRACRLKFPPRSNPKLEQIRATKAQARRQSTKRRPPMHLSVVTAPDSVPVGIMERTGCCYPTTKEGPHLFCNAATSGNTDYCEFHLQVMYPRRRAA